MENGALKKVAVILAFAGVGWAGCAATMGFGMAVTSEGNALIIHAIAAPLIFGALALIYFTKFKYTSPLLTAAIFLSVVIAVDFFVVALLMLKSFEMFRSPLGTWIPFALIFFATYLMGATVRKRAGS